MKRTMLVWCDLFHPDAREFRVIHLHTGKVDSVYSIRETADARALALNTEACPGADKVTYITRAFREVVVGQ